MAANLPAPLVGRVGRRLDLVLAHGHGLDRPRQAVPTGRIQLDHLHAIFDLCPDGFAELVRTVTDIGQALHPEVPERRMAIDRVTSRDYVTARRHEAWAGNQPRVDGLLERDIDIVQGAGPDRAGETAAQQQLGVFGRNQRQMGRVVLHINVVQIADIGVGDVVVALDHARHQRLAVQVVDRVLSGRLGHPTVGADGGNALVLNHHGGVGFGPVQPVNQICPTKKSASHTSALLWVV